MKDAERILATIRIISLIMMVACVSFLFKVFSDKSDVLPVETVLYPDPLNLHGEYALSEVAEFLKISPRVSGTENARLAAEYIKSVLLTNGLSAAIDEFTEATPSGKVPFRNVEAVIKGAGSAPDVVLISHYDTKAGISESFTGANDSGSSTGLLLELAKTLKKEPRYPFNIIFAFVDGEECVRHYSVNDGLHGSRRLAEKLTRQPPERAIGAVIVLDMIGDRNLTVTVPSNCDPKLTSLLLSSAEQMGYRDKFSLFRKRIIDDHVPFVNKGIRALDIIDFKFGEKEGDNEHWHTDNDTIDKLSAESLEITGRVLINMLNKLASGS